MLKSLIVNLSDELKSYNEYLFKDDIVDALKLAETGFKKGLLM
jgi:hypothetical protein